MTLIQEMMSHPNVINIIRLRAIGRLHIFIAKFESTTRCSAASEDDFATIEVLDDKIATLDADASRFVEKIDATQLGWSFFSLGDTSKKSGNMLNSPSEAERMASLQLALGRGIKIINETIQFSVSNFDERRHFCQFSGGGDLYLELNKQATVVCDGAIVS